MKRRRLDGSAGRVLRAIRSHRRFLVTTHARGDGDAIGSLLASAAILRALGKSVQLVHEGPIAEELRALPGIGAIASGLGAVRPGFDALLVLDAADADRLEGLRPVLDAGAFTINVDHHRTNTRFGDVNWVDPAAAATGEMLWELVRRSGIRAGRDLATNLYAAILTDTGRFSFSNTTPRVLRMAADLLALGVRPAEVARPLFRNRTQGDLRLLGACMRALRFSSDGRIGWLWLTRDRIRRAGAKPRDSQEYIEIVKSVRGVEVALLFRNTDEPGLVKLSIRTETGVDASALAAAFGGGGHPRAGGATIPGSGRAVERRVLAEVRRRLPRRRPQRRLRSLPNPLSQEHP